MKSAFMKEETEICDIPKCKGEFVGICDTHSIKLCCNCLLSKHYNCNIFIIHHKKFIKDSYEFPNKLMSCINIHYNKENNESKINSKSISSIDLKNKREILEFLKIFKGYEESRKSIIENNRYFEFQKYEKNIIRFMGDVFTSNCFSVYSKEVVINSIYQSGVQDRQAKLEESKTEKFRSTYHPYHQKESTSDSEESNSSENQSECNKKITQDKKSPVGNPFLKAKQAGKFIEHKESSSSLMLF